MSAIAFVPARKGSKRIMDKNARLLGGRPLMAWAIQNARDAGCFDAVFVSTDSERYRDLALLAGAQVIMRPTAYATDTSPDVQWFTHAASITWEDYRPDYMAILRPTSPFLKPGTISDALETLKESGADSIRGVRRASENPGKMWATVGDFIFPVLPFEVDGVPWHSNQGGKLPKLWVQTAGVEIVKSAMFWASKRISGWLVAPYFLEGAEALDINTEEDWERAESIVKARQK